MLVIIFKLVHAFLGLNAIGTGIAVSIRMVQGGQFEKLAVRFLKYSLAASATGMLLSLDHPDLMSCPAAFGVYLSGVAMLASRKAQLSEDWALGFLLTTSSVLCLDTVVAIAHVFRLLTSFNIVASSPDTLVFFVAALIAGPLFAALSVVSARRMHLNATSSAVHKATR